jgi:hypothetical protein
LIEAFLFVDRFFAALPFDGAFFEAGFALTAAFFLVVGLGFFAATYA